MSTVAVKSLIELKKLRCDHCMRKWKQEGKNPEKMPKAYSQTELEGNKCPDCGNIFRNHCAF